MGVKVVAYDIEGGEGRENLGIYESVQMTGRQLRDTEGNIILWWFGNGWVSMKSGKSWYDWTVEGV